MPSACQRVIGAPAAVVGSQSALALVPVDGSVCAVRSVTRVPTHIEALSARSGAEERRRRQRWLRLHDGERRPTSRIWRAKRRRRRGPDWRVHSELSNLRTQLLQLFPRRRELPELVRADVRPPRVLLADDELAQLVLREHDGRLVRCGRAEIACRDGWRLGRARAGLPMLPQEVVDVGTQRVYVGEGALLRQLDTDQAARSARAQNRDHAPVQEILQKRALPQDRVGRRHVQSALRGLLSR